MAGCATATGREVMHRLSCLLALLLLMPVCHARGTGDLGIVIERAGGSVQVIETSTNTSLGSIDGLGDLSHASAVYSRDGRYAFVDQLKRHCFGLLVVTGGNRGQFDLWRDHGLPVFLRIDIRG